MLDDLKFIHQRDGLDALGIAEKQWQQLQHDFGSIQLDFEFDNIIYAGMGGSALAALYSRSWPGYKLPFEVIRDYHIPAYVSGSTLFIASSYSGNTEETLSALAAAEQKGAKIVVITRGGKLQQAAEAKSYPMLTLPDTKQPRYAVLANLKAIIQLLEETEAFAQKGVKAELEAAVDFLKEAVTKWLPTVPTDANPAKALAAEIAGKSPVIYAGPLLAPAAYKWKINFNENAKNVAWWGELPEFNHNEFIGWSSHPPLKPYTIVELRSSLELDRVQKRFEVAERLLSGKRPAPNIVPVGGETLLQQLLWATAFGDFTSIYLALLNNVDPGPVDLVEKFKLELDK